MTNTEKISGTNMAKKINALPEACREKINDILYGYEMAKKESSKR